MTPVNDRILAQDTVYALARSSETLYAARTSGLYRSRDEGRTWQAALTSLDQPEPILVTSVAAWDGMIFAGVKGAVLRSYDGGENWHIGALASPPPLVTGLALSPNFEHDGVIAAATAEDGVFISDDRGQSWTGWNFGLVDMNVFAVAISPNFQHDRVLFAGTESGIFRSRDGGRAWDEVDFPTEAAPVLSLGLSPLFASDGVMYVGTESSGLFKSEDSGLSWQQVAALTERDAIHSIQFDHSQKLWVLLESKLLVKEESGLFIEFSSDHFPPESIAMALLLPGLLHAPLIGFAAGELLHL